MVIDQNKCLACGQCIPYCPKGCIIKADEKITIDLDECIECEICKNSDVCPANAFYMQELDELRMIRNQFSNPLVTHPGTGVPGRGTEEMKTNDVTGRFKRGRAGIAIELGRPGTCACLSDVQLVAMAVAPFAKYGFEPHNPVTELMTDTSTGALREDVLNEKVLSAIVELEIDQVDIAAVLDKVKSVQDKVNTVFSVDLACRLEPDESCPAAEIASKYGYALSLNGKTNVGLGRPLAKED